MYCHSFSERSSDNNYGVGTIENEGQKFKEPNGNFSSFAFVFIPGMFIVLSFAILVVFRRFIFSSEHFSYTPVAFDNNSRDDERLIEAEYDDESETEADHN